MMEYRVSIDRILCISCGLAPTVCPQVFILGDDNGKDRLLDKYSKETSNDISLGIISDNLYDCVREAADVCPVQAITVQRK